jgi:very-short-patch-repair endonuclease
MGLDRICSPPLAGGVWGRGYIKEMPSKLTRYAKRLRRNATQAESQLWNRLRARRMEGIKFRRQQPIENLIVDFVSFEKRIVIEIDGGQHAMVKDKDNERDALLDENGFTVLRFWNNEVLQNIDGVLEVIRQKCVHGFSPSPGPSRQGREK